MPQPPITIPLTGSSFEDTVRTFSELDGFFAIDARAAHPSSGRCSIVSALPIETFSIAGAFVAIDGHTTIDSPFSALTRFCGRASAMPSDPYLPFSGGIAGYIGFEGARAIKGLCPASGFSRHSQCRLGIYPAAVLFDHVEGTTTLVANGDNWDEAQKRADAFLDIIESGSRRNPVATATTPSRSSVRFSPDESSLKKILTSARHWLRSDNVRHIHLVRHIQRPQEENSAIEGFLKGADKDALQAIFTHEGSAYIVTSWDTLIATSGRRLRSMLTFEANTPNEFKIQRSLTEDARARICGFCADASQLTERTESDGPNRRRVTFECMLSHELSPIDALIGLLPSQRLTGSPHERALDFIEANEEMHRSLYGGAFGTMDALRCSFGTVQKVAVAADGSLGTTVGLDLTEEFEDNKVFEKFDSLIREARTQAD